MGSSSNFLISLYFVAWMIILLRLCNKLRVAATFDMIHLEFLPIVTCLYRDCTMRRVGRVQCIVDHATIMTQMHELKSNLIKLAEYCALTTERRILCAVPCTLLGKSTAKHFKAGS